MCMYVCMCAHICKCVHVYVSVCHTPVALGVLVKTHSHGTDKTTTSYSVSL